MISSFSLLLAQIYHERNRLLIGAAENDFLFEQRHTSHDLLTQSLVVRIVGRHDSDFIFPRRQIHDDELSSRINFRRLPILHRLVYPARQGIEPRAGRDYAADYLHLAAERERAVNKNEPNTGHLLSRAHL